MSSRHLRKLREEKDKSAKEPDETEEDYQPLYAQQAKPKFTYEGLELTSSSDAEQDSPSSRSDENEPVPEPAHRKKNNRKNKKKKKAQKKSPPADGEEDEIEKTVKEVNALLGFPEPAPAPSQAAAKPLLVPEILVVQHKHLNVANELKRKFGSDGEERRRVNRHAQLRIIKKSVLIPSLENVAFVKNGLSMSILRREGGYTYFVFDHSEEYRRRHQRMMHVINKVVPDDFEDVERSWHVEGMIQKADELFRFGESTPGNKLIEMSIAYMQYVAHPSFQLTDPQTRLPYQYVENRPFHVAVLKYLHLLTNRACHRTALELAKMLLNLDPTDPLAVLFIIDTVALRAREHQWLINAINHWDKERQAGYLFNMKFSKALAQFHVDSSNGGDFSAADKELQDAIMRFPIVPLKIMDLAKKTPDERVQSCPLFATARTKISKKLQELIDLYTEFTWSKWRETEVFEWLLKNTKITAEKYYSDPKVQDLTKSMANEYANLFRTLPEEIVRHLCVIFNMSQLLVDGAVPTVLFLFAFDPVPPANGVNRYNYSRTGAAAAPPTSAIRDLFSSLLPNFAPASLEYLIAVERNNPAVEMAAAWGGAALNDDFDSDEFDMNFGDDADGDMDLFAAVRSLEQTVARAAALRAPDHDHDYDRPQAPQ